MAEKRDEFLSEEDLDLKNLSFEELVAVWNLWLQLAQATNDTDEHEYSHGVFRESPRESPRPQGEAADPARSRERR
jgi:hypothetical protein